MCWFLLFYRYIDTSNVYEVEMIDYEGSKGFKVYNPDGTEYGQTVTGSMTMGGSTLRCREVDGVTGFCYFRETNIPSNFRLSLSFPDGVHNFLIYPLPTDSKPFKHSRTFRITEQFRMSDEFTGSNMYSKSEEMPVLL